VSYKDKIKIESGIITFANGDTYEGDWSQVLKEKLGKKTRVRHHHVR